MDNGERRFVKQSNRSVLVEVGVPKSTGNGLTPGKRKMKCLFSELRKSKTAQLGSLYVDVMIYVGICFSGWGQTAHIFHAMGYARHFCVQVVHQFFT